MAIRGRPAQPGDIRKCVEVVCAHPVLRHRYAEILADLPYVMESLRGREAFACTVFEEVEQFPRILGGSVSTFVQESFFREIKTPPSFWGTPEIVRRELKGESVILSDSEVLRANAGDGLNMFIWHLGVLNEDAEHLEVAASMLNSFVNIFRGYNLKEFLGQPDTQNHFIGMRNAGGIVIRPSDGRYADYHESIDVDVTKVPVSVGITRELAQRASIGSWISSLFQYSSPQMGLSRAQQRLLSAALAGHTDEELGGELGISLFTVKKVWREIDRRAAEKLPVQFANFFEENQAQHRGRQKRHHLLAYLHEHPEELRPILRQATPSTHAVPRPHLLH
jgi:DNA-binding CsgD family transcriptional regulator